MTLNFPSPLQPISSHALRLKQLFIKRDDLLHPIISGNKARKLLRLINLPAAEHPTRILTMGGNRSNYLHALSYLCWQKKISLKAYIRGHQPSHYHSTLNDMVKWGAELEFVTKDQYRLLREDLTLGRLRANKQGDLWLPEGGATDDAVEAIAEGIFELETSFAQGPDIIFVPVGTGSTFLGLIKGIQSKCWQTKVVGVSAVKDSRQIRQWLDSKASEYDIDWSESGFLEDAFADSGFGKVNAPLLKRQADYESMLSCLLEPIYTTKTMDALVNYANSGVLENANVLLWHTGGLQGRTK